MTRKNVVYRYIMKRKVSKVSNHASSEYVSILMCPIFGCYCICGSLTAFFNHMEHRHNNFGDIVKIDNILVNENFGEDKMKREQIICPLCIKDAKIFCKRNTDARCVICEQEFCGAHIGEHLKNEHCVSLNLNHCSI